MRPPIAVSRLPVVGEEINAPFARFDNKAYWLTVIIKAIKATAQEKVLAVLFDECSGRTEERTLHLSEWGPASVKGKWYIPIPPAPEALSKRKHKHKISRERAIARLAKAGSPVAEAPKPATTVQTRSPYGIKAPRHLMKTPPTIEIPDPIVIPSPIRKDKQAINNEDGATDCSDCSDCSDSADDETAKTIDITQLKADLDRQIDERLDKFFEKIKEYVSSLPSTSSQPPTLTNEYLEQRLETLKDDLINRFENYNPEDIPRVLGVWRECDKARFENLAIEKKNMYIPGPLTRVYYKNRPLCALYKMQGDHKCASLNQDGEVYVTSHATFVNLRLFGSTPIRSVHTKAALNELQRYAICNSCREAHGSKDHFVNIKDHNNVCACCKVNNGSDSTDCVLPMCLKCNNARFGRFDSSTAIAIAFIDTLRLIFTELGDMRIIPEYRVKDKYNQEWRIDFVVFGKYRGKSFCIIVEVDGNQHVSENSIAEREKTLAQAFVLQDGGVEKDNYDSILTIRLNPDGKYNSYNPIPSTQLEESNFSKIERYVIFRQWVLWWILNLNEMRKCAIIYMFYNWTRKNMLTANTWNGFAMIYDRPFGKDVTAWTYAPVYTELCQSSYQNINFHQDNKPRGIHPDNVPGFVWKKSDVDERDIYPPDWGKRVFKKKS